MHCMRMCIVHGYRTYQIATPSLPGHALETVASPDVLSWLGHSLRLHGMGGQVGGRKRLISRSIHESCYGENGGLVHRPLHCDPRLERW